MVETIDKKTLKIKIAVLSIAPMVVITGFIALLLFTQAKQLVEYESTILRENLTAAKKQELKQYIDLAERSFGPIYENAGPHDSEAKQKVIDLLNRMTYGSDGYFFAYTWSGDSLVLPYQPERVGKNWWDVEDVTGKKLLQELITVAQQGGGFVDYLWHKPSLEEPLPKLSYAVSLDKWGWMIGSGIYMDDIELQVSQLHAGFKSRVGQSAAASFIIIITAVSIISGLAASLNLNIRRLADKRLSELNEQIIVSQEAERTRVSRELHDGINQLLAAAKYRLDNLSKEPLEPMESSELGAGQLAIDNAIVEVRRISRDLRPTLLDDLGLVAAIDNHIAEVQERTGIELLFEHDIDDLTLKASTETTLYRVIQESLRNIEKHSQAQAADIILQQEGRHLILTVTDDGKGFRRRIKDRKQIRDSNGMGLRNMSERIEQLGGDFYINSTLGEGTEIKVVMEINTI
ncbi:cache domain-containing protein [Aliivibrio kagoshimensis]|uniref:cache domain-containing protein n=1 Tax=Aliivibrio kagoshimensis TaxID=2910230 RepID=UPI003D14C2AA